MLNMVPTIGKRRYFSNKFKSEYLTLIIQNLLFKAENEWDDYNEVYKCYKLIPDVKSNKNMSMDFRIILKLSIIGGQSEQ